MLTRRSFSCLLRSCSAPLLSRSISFRNRGESLAEHHLLLHSRSLRLERIRHFSAISTGPPSGPETVLVPTKSNGAVTLTIYPPLSGEPFAPTILYLPPGPVLSNSNLASDQHIIAALSASSGGTIVRVNYRFGDSAHYPLAIHDVLAGYDWVTERLQEYDGGENIHTVGVCGQLVGGSLAAMLALTECRIGQTRVAAAALNAPVLDWVFPHGCYETPSQVDDIEESRILEAKKSKGRKKKVKSSWEEFRKSQTLPASSLLKARNGLFKTADSYFDPFASPIHFFRGPGIEVPNDLSNLSHELDNPEPTPVPIRKSRRTYPPTASNLALPATRLSIGDSNILLSQGKEYMDTLQMRWIKGSLKMKRVRLRNVDKAMTLDEDQASETDAALIQAEKRFALKILPDAGLWGYGEEQLWREDVESAGRWLREVLI